MFVGSEAIPNGTPSEPRAADSVSRIGRDFDLMPTVTHMDDRAKQSTSGRSGSLRRDEVTELIRQAILDLRVKPGQRLIEREVLEWTHASRATVREAIRELAKEGLIDLIPMKGAVVAKPTIKEIQKIYELRTLLEGFAARLFTENASDDQLDVLRGIVSELEEIVSRQAVSDKLWDFYSVKSRYYQQILEATDNPYLNETLADLLKRMVAVRVGYFAIGTGGEASMKEIREVMSAIEARNPDAAESAARRHVEARCNGNLLNLALLYEETEPKIRGRHGRDG